MFGKKTEKPSKPSPMTMDEALKTANIAVATPPKGKEKAKSEPKGVFETHDVLKAIETKPEPIGSRLHNKKKRTVRVNRPPGMGLLAAMKIHASWMIAGFFVALITIASGLFLGISMATSTKDVHEGLLVLAAIAFSASFVLSIVASGTIFETSRFPG